MRRFDTLDGMRGAAAIAVMLHHVEMLLLGTAFLRAGYLAVDFFFMLSGFVIASAYERRFAEGLTPQAFTWLRIKRLWPVMAVGVIAGALAVRGMGPPELSLRFAAQLAFLPVILGALPLYPLNGVEWSLFFELFANVVHSVFLKMATVRLLLVLAVIALPLMAIAAWLNGNLGIGDRGVNFLGGFPRVLFSYTLGVILFRVRSRGFMLSVPVSGALLIATLPLVFLVDGFVRGVVSPWIVDVLIAATLLPALVAVGAAASLSPRFQPAARILGALSYPLYAVHLPAVAIAAALYGRGAAAAVFAVPLSLLAAFAVALALEPGGRALFTRTFWIVDRSGLATPAKMD